jgi:hypothetical protein
MRNRIAILVCVAVGVVGCVVLAAAQQEAAQAVSRQDGVRQMRAINSVEADIRGTSARFGSLADVVTSSGFSAGPVGDPVREDNDSALVRNHRITMLRSQDGSRYQVSIVPTSGSGLAFFSDQNGVIFVGEALR